MTLHLVAFDRLVTMAASSLSTGSLAYQQRLSAAEVEFLAEECLIAIIPKFQVEFFQFVEVIHRLCHSC